MTISIVQPMTNIGGGGNLPSAVTAGNTVILVAFCYDNGNSAVSTSNPTLNGSTPAGSTLDITETNPSGTNRAYAAIWRLPSCPAGNTLGITVGGGSSHLLELHAMELHSGAALTVDSTNGSQNLGSTAVTSGATGALTGAQSLLVAAAASFGSGFTAPGGLWTSVVGAFDISANYLTTSATSVTFTNTIASAAWAACILALKETGGAGHTATASLTVTPTFTATRVRGRRRTASLTVTPSTVATPRRGRRRTASLTVTPSTTATPHLGAPKTATASLTITPSFTATRVRGHPRTASLTVTPSTTATPRRGRSRTASLTVTPSTTVTRSHGQHRAASLTVTPSAAATGSKTGGGVKTATASLTVTPSFTATRVRGRSRTASLTVTPATIATPHAGHVIRAALALLPAFRATPHKSGSHPAARPGGPPDEEKTLTMRRIVWRMLGL